MAAIVQCRNVHKLYPLEDQYVIGLENINLRIPQGKFIAIMGPSGSGKSTLLYIMGGLDRPTEGEVIVAGHQLDGMSSEALAQFRRDTVGFVFQQFYLIPTLPALDNVALPGIFADIPRELREERAWQLLNALGLGDRIEHLPRQLSGGQQQRVAIARALFNDPPIIMADEPTGALDSETGLIVIKMLRKLCDDQGKTVILVTHDPAIARYADHILHLRDGRAVRQKQTRVSV